MNQWDTRFLEMAKLVASWSKDPSTKVGCLLVDDNRRIVGQGFNGFPRGMRDDGRLYDKAEKHKYVIHAEVNALLGGGLLPTTGTTAYIWPLHPCPSCAAKLIQAGVRRVVAAKPSKHHEEKYELAKVEALFLECGIIFHLIDMELEDENT